MSYNLVCHPHTPGAVVRSIVVEATRADRLSLTFRVDGDLDAIRWPDSAPAKRTDELWRHTCFEAFLAPVGTEYSEINVSPSGQWATYFFDGYRAGMHEAEAEVSVNFGAGILRADVAIDVPGDWQVGLTAVIELTDGTKSYWALAHAPGPPDFHNRDCFTVTLAAPDAS